MFAGDPSPVEFACPKCGQKVRAPAGRAGTSGKCPKCGGRTTVPGERPAFQEEKSLAQYDLPEGNIHVFESEENKDPRIFLSIVKEVVAKHCDVSVCIALLKGDSRDLVTVFSKSLRRYKELWKKHLDGPWDAAKARTGLQDIDIRPAMTVTNVADPGLVLVDDSTFWSIRGQILGGKFKLLEGWRNILGGSGDRASGR